MIIGIKIEMINKFLTQSCFQQKLSTEADLFYIIVSVLNNCMLLNLTSLG